MAPNRTDATMDATRPWITTAAGGQETMRETRRQRNVAASGKTTTGTHPDENSRHVPERGKGRPLPACDPRLSAIGARPAAAPLMPTACGRPCGQPPGQPRAGRAGIGLQRIAHFLGNRHGQGRDAARTCKRASDTVIVRALAASPCDTCAAACRPTPTPRRAFIRSSPLPHPCPLPPSSAL